MIDLLFTNTDEGSCIVEVVLNDPRTINSLDTEGLKLLAQVLDEAALKKPRALILRGEGKGFCAGRNIKGLNPQNDDATDFLTNHVTPVLKKIDHFPSPTFAAIHGPCLGIGLGLAQACDVVYVANNAKIGSPFANLGATLDCGGHSLFVERLGPHRTMDLIVTGELMSGAEAVSAGLFSRALPDEELLDFTRRIATHAAEGATLAFLASRQLVQDIRDNSTGLWDSIAKENCAQGQLCKTKDYYEGFDAFNHKRKPRFIGE